ncbi:MAG: hypothetical protein KME28_14650 [Pelatocladus maniniholoensis HA4357-MV3]|jgi:hypothetical protein|uniref:Uncharacterized protein n=1 Tax=Pelatocladus maniniholoensis HA4357-MV3 TaxID=1117104 RepID=A0A9E3HA15_9NOST|nr:hypothetical protein [Pelatocladus maniniholoensis HA4357-MV3]
MYVKQKLLARLSVFQLPVSEDIVKAAWWTQQRLNDPETFKPCRDVALQRLYMSKIMTKNS